MIGDALVTRVAGNQDIAMGANQISFTDVAILRYSPTALAVMNLAESSLQTLYVSSLIASTSFETMNTNDAYSIFYTRDNDVGAVEVGRLQSGADPYIGIGRDDTGVATNAITDMLVIRAGAGTNNEAQGFGAGVAFNIGNAASEVEKRGAINCYLETATNGSEDTDLHFWTMASGALNQAFKVGFNGELYADLDGDSGSYLTNGVNLFDDFDDVAELRKFQLTVPETGLISEAQRLANRERMRELGVIKAKEGGGDHLKIQTMFRLVSGGIYQTRQAVNELEKRLSVLEARG